jgi:hypothetical protein
MKDTQDIYIENLRESLKHYDAFLKLCVLSSLTAMVCSITARSGANADLVLFEYLPLPRSALSLFAHLAQVVFALLAASSLDSVYRAQRPLLDDPSVFRAALGYPSLATAPSTWIRQLAVLASPVVLAVSFIAAFARAKPAEWAGAILTYLFLCIPYLVLWLQAGVEQVPSQVAQPASDRLPGK